MNGIKGKLWAKLLAFVVFLVSVLALTASCAVVIYLGATDSFFDGGKSMREDVLYEVLRSKMYNIQGAVSFYTPYCTTDAIEFDSDLKTEDLEIVYNIQNKEALDNYVSSYSGTISTDSQNVKYLAEHLDNHYPTDSSNLLISISDSGGNVIYSNYDTDQVMTNRFVYDYPVAVRDKTVRIYTILDPDASIDDYINMLERQGSLGNFSSYRVGKVGAEEYDEYDEYNNQWSEVLYDTGSEIAYADAPLFDLDGVAEGSLIFDGIYTPGKSDSLHISIGVPDVLRVEDDISFTLDKVDLVYKNKNWFIAFIPIFGLILIISVVFLMSSAGYDNDNKGARLTLADKLPFELYILATVLIAVGCVCGLEYFATRYAAVNIAMFAVAECVFAVSVMISLMSFAARCKTGKFFITTITFGSFIYAYRAIKYLLRNRRVSTKVILLSSAVLIFDLLCLAAIASGSGGGCFVFIIEKILLFIFIIRYAVGMDRIKSGCKKLSEGETDVVIDENGMTHSLKCVAQDINSIGNGIQLAVEEKMKSERLKTELITNVSHDLKTPLTSIVNYVDILSKEDIQPDTAREYVDILVRQSQRMKKLINDLVEASKASSGAIPVNLERTDMSLLLTQAVAEYEERLEKAGVTPVLDFPDKPIPVMIDGRLMWRVFDNLMGNICKYAMNGTRAYVTSYEQDKKCYVTFKNISKFALNISPDELMERFVRGDSSRSTEGSGLGLSIARSLCALQNVDFEIQIDGDLFKAQLSVDIIDDDKGIENDSASVKTDVKSKPEMKAQAKSQAEPDVTPVTESDIWSEVKSDSVSELQPIQPVINAEADNMNTAIESAETQSDGSPLRTASPSSVLEEEDEASDSGKLTDTDEGTAN